ncbi:MAG: cupredoxin domain-containing protein [Anaerolineae bacterium]
MRKRDVLVAVALGLALLVAVGCGQQAASTATPTAATPAAATSAAAAPAEVVLKNFAFAPKELTVSVGTTITWTNQDSTAHTVTAGQRGSPSGLFDSGQLAAGRSFSFAFSEAGTYPYFCSLHPGMDGTIIVQ